MVTETQSITMVADTPSALALPAKPITLQPKKTTDRDVLKWGDDNLDPANILADIRLHPSLQSILYQKGRLLYGYGCFLGRVADEKEGQEKIVPLKDAKVQQFLDRSRFEQNIRIASLNYFRLENLFPELIMTKDRKEVYSINYLKAAMCRYGIQNEKTGLIDKLYYNANWGNSGTAANSNVIDVLNEYDPLGHLKNSKFLKAVYKSQGLDPEDTVGYRELSWGALRTSDWLKVAKSIPQFKSNLFANQSALKYHIQTTQEWWEWKYKGFMEQEQEQRIKTMKKEREDFEKVMTDPNAAGKSIFTTGKIDRNTGQFIPGWKIETLSNKFGSADYIEDMQEAQSQILTALNIPATLVGQSFGNKIGSGSGSDIREAYNMYQSTQEIERDIILEPWYDAMKYNGFSDEIRLVFRYPQITTLDQHSETKITDYTNE